MIDVNYIIGEAKQLNSCKLLNGNESFEELAELLFTPQGLEFCEMNKFPSIELLNGINKSEAENKNIYINTKVNKKNVKNIALFGSETEAVLEYDKLDSFKVLVMHGAKVTIKASGYAVVFLTNVDGEVKCEIKDNAMVL